MRDISYAPFSVATWGTNYLAAGGVDSVAMSIATAIPPYRDASPCWAPRRRRLQPTVLLLSGLRHNRTFRRPREPSNQLLGTALAWRRPGSLAAVAGAYLTLEP